MRPSAKPTCSEALSRPRASSPPSVSTRSPAERRSEASPVSRGRRGEVPRAVEEQRRAHALGEPGGENEPMRRQAGELAARLQALLRPDELLDAQAPRRERGVDAAELDASGGDPQRGRRRAAAARTARNCASACTSPDQPAPFCQPPRSCAFRSRPSARAPSTTVCRSRLPVAFTLAVSSVMPCALRFLPVATSAACGSLKPPRACRLPADGPRPRRRIPRCAEPRPSS